VDPNAETLAKWRFTAAASLLPATMVGIFVFGWYAGLLVLVALASAFLTDVACHRWIFRGPAGTSDGAWLLTGLLVALLLPPIAPVWLALLGPAAAIVIGKHWLSVDGMPLLQPAAVGVLLLHVVFFSYMHPTVEVRGQTVACWPVLAWPFAAPKAGTEESVGRYVVRQFLRRDVRHCVDRQDYQDEQFAGRQPMYDAKRGIQADAISGPRPLDLAHDNPHRALSDLPRPRRCEDLDILLGYTPGPIGGASALALLLGVLMLLFTGAAPWLIPAIGLGVLGAALLAFQNANVGIHLLSGPTLLGMFYLAADPAAAPRSKRGRTLAGLSVGVLEFALRSVFSEALFISALAVQALSFVFDQYVTPPREVKPPTEARLKVSSLKQL
jgi:electron transport complex protein RnfD